MPDAPSTQHPDGGVELFEMLPARPGVYAECLGWNPVSHIAFPVAQAARLIDVDAPQVRVRIARALVVSFGHEPERTVNEIADAILAALQKGAPE